MHPVMFGEYFPFSDRFPLWLKRCIPIANLAEGERAVAFPAGPLRLAPSICYETILAHVIRRQVRELAALGEEPDALVNLTNDGWFWGSSELDLHLMCGVFRAVECRKPLLIAANTGFSAWIDPDGRIVARGPRRDTGTLLATIGREPRQSWYLVYGDWFAACCLAACVLLAGIGCLPVRCRRASSAIPRATNPHFL
jgi:apolipoprotein N-acyltransferase